MQFKEACVMIVYALCVCQSRSSRREDFYERDKRQLYRSDIPQRPPPLTSRHRFLQSEDPRRTGHLPIEPHYPSEANPQFESFPPLSGFVGQSYNPPDGPHSDSNDIGFFDNHKFPSSSQSPFHLSPIPQDISHAEPYPPKHKPLPFHSFKPDSYSDFSFESDSHSGPSFKPDSHSDFTFKPIPAYEEPHIPHHVQPYSPHQDLGYKPKPAYEEPHHGGGKYHKKDAIPGEPGHDYPIYHTVPLTDFTCHDVPYRPGMYANPETGCQAYHVCNDDRHGPQGASFLCSNGTLFNQENFSCDWWYNVDCSRAKSLYDLNLDPKYNPYYQKPYEEPHYKSVDLGKRNTETGVIPRQSLSPKPPPNFPLQKPNRFTPKAKPKHPQNFFTRPLTSPPHNPPTAFVSSLSHEDFPSSSVFRKLEESPLSPFSPLEIKPSFPIHTLQIQPPKRIATVSTSRGVHRSPPLLRHQQHNQQRQFSQQPSRNSRNPLLHARIREPEREEIKIGATEIDFSFFDTEDKLHLFEWGQKT